MEQMKLCITDGSITSPGVLEIERPKNQKKSRECRVGLAGWLAG
jgi:hypothetical protein